MDINLIQSMKNMIERKRELEQELKRLNVEIAETEKLALDQFTDAGVDSIKINGSTLYLHRQLWVGVAEGFTKEQASKQLKEVGLGDYVQESFNINSLSAYYREATRESDDVHIPEALKLDERYSIRMRK